MFIKQILYLLLFESFSDDDWVGQIDSFDGDDRLEHFEPIANLQNRPV